VNYFLPDLLQFCSASLGLSLLEAKLPFVAAELS